MTGQEAIEYIHSFQWEKHAPGLCRIRELLERLGNPQKDLKFIHVAGTNGKGSTCAVLDSVLRSAGYRVGLNTSPYIMTFHERIRVDGEVISDAALADLTERVRPVAESMAEHPTEFELITAIAMLYFKEQRCDIVVLEVGLGGALDASNVIDVPEVAVIAAMGMDHVALLGPTLTDIAREKAGVIKPGGSVVSYGGCPEADAVFRHRCAEVGAYLDEVDFSALSHVETGLTGAEFGFGTRTNLRIPLVGVYQVRNAALAITALEVLREKGWNISEEALREGLARTQWAGRFEVLGREPVFLLDGAHNAHGMQAAVESLRALLPGQKLMFVLGMLADKDTGDMLDLLAPLAQQAFAVQPESPRAMDAQDLSNLLKARGVPAKACESVEDAVAAAIAAAGKSGAVCALGSLYMSGAVRRAMGQN